MTGYVELKTDLIIFHLLQLESITSVYYTLYTSDITEYTALLLPLLLVPCKILNHCCGLSQTNLIQLICVTKLFFTNTYTIHAYTALQGADPGFAKGGREPWQARGANLA